MMVNGYIYYNNNVIKIRYDLLKDKNNTTDYQEDQIFDWYSNVLKVEQGLICETDMPIVEINSERLIYILKNPVDLAPKRLLLMPFLHNRNVLMKQLNPDHEYFSSVLNKRLHDENGNSTIVPYFFTMSLSDFHVQIFSPKGFQLNRYDIL